MIWPPLCCSGAGWNFSEGNEVAQRLSALLKSTLLLMNRSALFLGGHRRVRKLKVKAHSADFDSEPSNFD